MTHEQVAKYSLYIAVVISFGYYFTVASYKTAQYFRREHMEFPVRFPMEFPVKFPDVEHLTNVTNITVNTGAYPDVSNLTNVTTLHHTWLNLVTWENCSAQTSVIMVDINQ